MLRAAIVAVALAAGALGVPAGAAYADGDDEAPCPPEAIGCVTTSTTIPSEQADFAVDHQGQSNAALIGIALIALAGLIVSSLHAWIVRPSKQRARLEASVERGAPADLLHGEVHGPAGVGLDAPPPGRHAPGLVAGAEAGEGLGGDVPGEPLTDSPKIPAAI